MTSRRILIAMTVWLASGLRVLASDDAELPGYFAGLRTQGLFRVAEEYALARLAEPELTPAQNAILAVELSKVFAAHAAEAGSDAEAEELWQRAGESITPLLIQRDNPRWGTLRSRRATLLCDRALTEFWRSQLASESEPQREVALQAALAALRDLKSARVDLASDSPSVPRGAKPGVRGGSGAKSPPSLASGTLTTVERRRIHDEIDYLTVRMNLNLARLQPTGPDQAAALLDAGQGSAALAKQVNSEFVWPARLARVETLRLQGDPEKAYTLAKSWLAPDLSPEIMDALFAEQARAKLAQNAPAEAIQLIIEHGQAPGRIAPELRAITIECLLTSMHTAQDQGDTALADELWKQAAAQQQRIAGPWRAYVDATLSRTSETRQYGAKLAALVREGRLAAQRRDWAAAATAYEQASQVATLEGKPGLAAEFSYTQASIEIEAGHFEQASQLLSEYQTHYPGDARAADAHLLAAWTLGKLHEQRPGPASRAAYLAKLKEHIAKFPDSPTHIEAEWSLAVDAIQHQEWSVAIDFLEAIPPDHARAVDAAAQLPYCFEQALAQLTDKLPRQKWDERAESSLARQLASWPPPPAGWTLAQSQNALRWARVLLQLRDRRYADAEKLLLQILHSRDVESREIARDESKLDPQWDQLVPAATQVRIISLAGLGRSGEAETMFSAATTASPEDVLAILSGLSELAAGLDEPARHDLGRIQLAAARRLDRQRSTLNPEMAIHVDRCLAEAYTATGDLPEAIAIYETQLKAHPRDRQFLETIGTLSVKRGQPADLKRAKAVYRQLESFDPAGSSAWLRTRLTVARVCFQLGDKVECQKLLKVTRILYPELGGVELQAEYLELEKHFAGSK